MNEEMRFAKILAQVRELAKKQGNCVSEEQVKDAFSELLLKEEQMEMVFDYLTKHKVGIGTPPDPDDYMTEEEKDYLQTYLDELTQLKKYSDGEKRAYTMSAMAGDAKAQNILVEIHLAEVAEIAKLYAGQGVLLEDLIGEGNVALAFGVSMLGSLEEPDEADGMLARLIMDAMEEYIGEHTENEKREKKVLERVNKVSQSARELSEELHRKITVEELAEETGMSDAAIRDAVRMSGFQIDYIE